MDLGGRIIIVFIIALISIHLLDLKTPIYEFVCSVLSMPEPGHMRNQAIYHLAKMCIFLIAIVGIIKILSSRNEE